MFIKYSNSSEFKWKFEIGNNSAAEFDIKIYQYCRTLNEIL
jgi:hypothetical protein